MYSAQPNGADSATINPAALASSGHPGARGIKRSRSPDAYQESAAPGSTGDDGDQKPRKRGRQMKSRLSESISESPGQPPLPPMPQTIPPLTPQSQNAPLPPPQTAPAPAYAPAPAPAPAQASPPPKTTPTKSTLKALPTVRDHTTDQLGPGGDEYIPREIDEAGEKKILANGALLGGREYRCRTFLVPNRGDKLFMLATECARVLGYRDSYLLFNKNRSLFKIIANQVEKDELVANEILPFSYRSRQIAIVTARSMFRQFGSRVIVSGRRVRDDYWETKARKQGFTEDDMAGEKRPGASKAREAAAAAEAQNAALLGAPHGEVIYSSNPTQFGAPPPPQLVQPDYNDTRSRDYSNILKTGPRQEITGPPYQDRTQPTPMPELHAQAHHAAEFNRQVNSQREMRTDYMQNMWRRPHEQPPPTTLSQPAPTNSTLPTTASTQSPHTVTAGLQQQHSNMVPNQSPQMMMTAPPYSTPIQAQNPINQSSNIRGSSGTLPQNNQNYGYQASGQMWPPTPQTPQYGYTTQAQQSPHPQPSSTSQMRHSSTGAQVQPAGMPYSGMPGMGQGYPAAAPYDHQTPRQYMHQGGAAAPAVTQAWSGQQQPQWWPNQPQ